MFDASLIAPCGMNCGVCINYLAMKYDLKKQGIHRGYCPGCLPRNKNCLYMAGHCENLEHGLLRFCFQCDDFPCKKLRALDKRYRIKYHLSMIDNLNSINTMGLDAFLADQTATWRCPHCNEVICCHNGLCLHCQLDILLSNKKYHWDEQ